jgi:peptidoglycan/xylan/chitin deacetylase (PgdA/CDA1 family)
VNGQLLDALGGAGVKAMFFPSLARIGGQPGLPLVRLWGERGHLIGNHTASHRSLSSKAVSLEAFVADTEEADRVLASLPNFRRLLRFPYLKEGNDTRKRDGVRDWMAANDYAVASVSVDTSDWYYEQVDGLLRAQGNEQQRRLLLDAYVTHLLERAKFYDELARSVLGRSPDHVALLHVSALNARAVPELVKAFRDRGWTFIDPATAYKDPMYGTPPPVLPAGESIVWSLARQAGREGLRYPAEDSVYERGRLAALGLPTP